MDIEKETDVLSDIANFFGLKKKDITPKKVVTKTKAPKKPKTKKPSKKSQKKDKKQPFENYVKKTRKYSKNGNDYTETYRYPQATIKFPFKKPTAADMKGLQYHEVDNYATTNVTF